MSQPHVELWDVPARAGTHETVIKKSRFLTSVWPVATPEAASEAIAAVRKEHWDATHNCTAYVLGREGDQQRSSDDGEPAGTAGVPMLQVLTTRQVSDVAVVVTRYYGGVKLGAGGLIRAYGQCVSDALDAVGTRSRAWLQHWHIDVPHADAGRYEHELRNWMHTQKGQLFDTEYGQQARLRLAIAPELQPELSAWLESASAGALSAEPGKLEVVVL